MKRISLIALTAILLASWTSVANATGFEPLGVDGLRRITGFGFGQGYHSLPKNPALRQAYAQAQCRQLPVQPPPAYPCAPRAPEASRGCGTCGGNAQQGMVQYAGPQMMMGPIQQPVMGGHMMQSPATMMPQQGQNGWTTDESKHSWQEVPEAQKAVEPKRDTADEEDSPQRDKLPDPEVEDEAQLRFDTQLPGENMLDELESYFGNGNSMGASPESNQQSQIRRLPPTKSEIPTTTAPVSVDPNGPPQPKESDIWW